MRTHILFVTGIAVSLAGFVAIWSPKLWQMVAGATVGCVGMAIMILAAWKLAAARKKRLD